MYSDLHDSAEIKMASWFVLPICNDFCSKNVSTLVYFLNEEMCEEYNWLTLTEKLRIEATSKYLSLSFFILLFLIGHRNEVYGLQDRNHRLRLQIFLSPESGKYVHRKCTRKGSLRI